MGLTSVDSGTNGCNCGCEDCQRTYQAPVELVKTISGVRRNVIYYDPDLFCETILISPSLLIGIDEPPWDTHYNIAHDEDLGTSGTAWKPLEDITVAINPKPKDTQIEGQKRMLADSTHTYTIGQDEPYDTGNYFTYDWRLEGSALFDNATQENLNAGKEVDITFNGVQTVTISVTITNTCGCSRVVTRDVYPGTFTRNLLVVRYPYF
jgi:hypothetical protein